jgi:hypothetical protein
MSETTIIYIEGIAVVACAIIVFMGSIWLLLTMVLGGRLAYFITASVVFGFLSIMGVVWSMNQLGPVGTLPSWSPVAYSDSAKGINFGPISSYPNSPWKAVDTANQAEAAKASIMESAATTGLGDAINGGKVTGFTQPSEALVDPKVDRFLEQGSTTYGAVTFKAVKGNASAVAVLKYDPGDPLTPARHIALGMFGLFVLHLFGLSRAEKKSKAGRLTENGTVP